LWGVGIPAQRHRVNSDFRPTGKKRHETLFSLDPRGEVREGQPIGREKRPNNPTGDRPMTKHFTEYTEREIVDLLIEKAPEVFEAMVLSPLYRAEILSKNPRRQSEAITEREVAFKGPIIHAESIVYFYG
jgi:hypothetical protein